MTIFKETMDNSHDTPVSRFPLCTLRYSSKVFLPRLIGLRMIHKATALRHNDQQHNVVKPVFLSCDAPLHLSCNTNNDLETFLLPLVLLRPPSSQGRFKERVARHTLLNVESPISPQVHDHPPVDIRHQQNPQAKAAALSTPSSRPLLLYIQLK